MGYNIFGPRARSRWSPAEKKAGFGFAGNPFSNVGVQYGLRPLKRGEITVDQFIDLNQKLGGLDVDIKPQAERQDGDLSAVRRTYRSGMLNLGQHMDEIAMINFGGPDPGAAHDYAHAWWMERRMVRAQGGETGNRVMWFGLTPLLGDVRWFVEGFTLMDQWLTAVEADHSRRSLAEKIIADKPGTITDRCLNIPGIVETTDANGEVDCVLPDETQLNLSSPREQAGSDNYNDNLKCVLEPLSRRSFTKIAGAVSNAQWKTLQGIFPSGVCDYSKPSQGEVDNETWLTYADASGDVIFGGRNLARLPRGQAWGWSSDVFASELRQ